MVVVLKKLTCGALLSPSEASEEFREGVIRCFRALLLRLDTCSDVSCLCKQVLGVPALSKGRDLRTAVKPRSEFVSEPEECLLAFLQSQTVSAAVGHWLSLLLKVCQCYLLLLGALFIVYALFTFKLWNLPWAFFVGCRH